jgi:cytochrome c peroxidase
MIPLLLAAVIAIPLGLDLYMPVPEDNPLTAARIEIGRRLFDDTRLSRDGTIACSSCHNPGRGFSDGRVVPIGVFGREGTRNAAALINRGYGRMFFWDGRAKTLEEQVLKPIEDPNEMDLPVGQAATRVGLDVRDLSQGLASYVRSILSGDAPYDRFLNGDRGALSQEQQRGLQIFRGKGNCTTCHVGPTFSDEQLHNTGVAWRESRAGCRSPRSSWEARSKSRRRPAGSLGMCSSQCVLSWEPPGTVTRWRGRAINASCCGPEKTSTSGKYQ